MLKNLDLSFKSRLVISYHLNDYILKELRVAIAVFIVLNYKSRFSARKINPDDGHALLAEINRWYACEMVPLHPLENVWEGLVMAAMDDYRWLTPLVDAKALNATLLFYCYL